MNFCPRNYYADAWRARGRLSNFLLCEAKKVFDKRTLGGAESLLCQAMNAMHQLVEAFPADYGATFPAAAPELSWYFLSKRREHQKTCGTALREKGFIAHFGGGARNVARNELR